MRVMVIMKASKDSEAGVMPSQKMLEEMTSYNEELVANKIMVAGEGLHPSSRGARVRFGGDAEPTIIDGPFAETKELIAGFWIWQVKDFEEALAWAKRIPNTDGAHHEVEVRRIFSTEDFGEAATPEILEREQRMREQGAGYGEEKH